MRSTKERKEGFSLLELMVVTAVVAILGAVAVSNFLDARTRAKVSRAKADLRTLIAAIEAYAVDHNSLPAANPNTQSFPFNTKLSWFTTKASLELLTTPIAYISASAMLDPFMNTSAPNHYYSYNKSDNLNVFDCADVMSATGGNSVNTPLYSVAPEMEPMFARLHELRYYIFSNGPDETCYAHSSGAAPTNAGYARAFYFLIKPEDGVGWDLIYNPTNGTISTGDIVWTGKDGLLR
jgi:prepilin-type N-terminal cleavage/methylation domain-containing protein